MSPHPVAFPDQGRILKDPQGLLRDEHAAVLAVSVVYNGAFAVILRQRIPPGGERSQIDLVVPRVGDGGAGQQPLAPFHKAEDQQNRVGQSAEKDPPGTAEGEARGVDVVFLHNGTCIAEGRLP